MVASNLDEPGDIANVGSRLSLPAVVQYGERIGEYYKIYDKDGSADVWGLVKTLNGKVKISDGDESLAINGEGDFTIFIPSHTPHRRDRFTIAHELGHYFLHYRYLQEKHQSDGSSAALLPNPVHVFNRGAQDRTETEANWFASALLMPTNRFLTVWELYSGEVREVAKKFDVSANTVIIRARALDLVE